MTPRRTGTAAQGVSGTPGWIPAGWTRESWRNWCRIRAERCREAGAWDAAKRWEERASVLVTEANGD